MNMSNEPTKEELFRRRAISIAEKLFAQQNKMFLRYSMLVPELEHILRWGCIQIALNDPEFAIEGRPEEYKQTFSHAAVLTGLSRQEIAHVVQQETAPVDPVAGALHRVIRILTAWRMDPGYQDESGKPIDLPLRGARPSLHQLCIKYGRDTSTRAIADGIVKSGNAEWIGESEGNRKGKTLRYLHPVVTADLNSAEDAAILTQIGSDFMFSFQQAFDRRIESQPRFREGCFNDIDFDRIDEAIMFLHEEIHRFGVRCTDGLRQFRTDSDKAKVRVGAGAYSFCGAPLLINKTKE